MVALTQGGSRPAVGRRPKPRRRTELGLLAMAALVIVAAYLLASLGLSHGLPPHVVGFLVLILVLALAAHLATRRFAPAANAVVLPVAFLLNGLGWVMIARLDSHLAANQALWSILGVALYVATLAVIRSSRDLERYRYLLALAGILLLLLPLAPVIGESINGARLWVHAGPVSFQPVELAKIALVLFFASYFVEKRELLATPTARIGGRLLPDPRAFGPFLAAFGFCMLAMVAERNVGFALLIFVIFLAMLWMAAGRFTYLVLGAALFALGTFVGAHVFSQVGERISVWLDPWAHATTTGYQLIQAEYALGSGGLTGTGLGLGHPGFVPVVYSDFIFTAFGEELGLLGTTVIVAAFVAMVGAGMRIALRARSEFAKLAASGLTTVLGFQAFFIMAGDVRLLPLTGVTLPFVAYGGSSLVANYLLLALLVRVSDEGERSDELR
ncbi:MAG: FtsW/RodA/SpoVE family cell cycle protein [Acidimicrobiales bacterium]